MCCKSAVDHFDTDTGNFSCLQVSLAWFLFDAVSVCWTRATCVLPHMSMLGEYVCKGWDMQDLALLE